MAVTKGPTQLQAIIYTYSDAGELVGIKAVVRVTVSEDGTPLASVNKDIDLWTQLNPGERNASNATAKRLKALPEA